MIIYNSKHKFSQRNELHEINKFTFERRTGSILNKKKKKVQSRDVVDIRTGTRRTSVH